MSIGSFVHEPYQMENGMANKNIIVFPAGCGLLYRRFHYFYASLH